MSVMLLLLAAGAALGQHRAPAETPGAWRGIESEFTNYPRLTAKERRHVLAQFTAVVDVFKAALALNPPIGIDVVPSISNIDLYSRFTEADGQPLPAMMWMRMHRYVATCPSCPPEPHQLWSGAFFVIANAIDALYENWRSPAWKNEDDEWYYFEPRVLRTTGGVSHFGGGDVVVTARIEPLFLAVTQERFLQTRIREAARVLAKTESIARQGTPYEQLAREREQRARARQEVIEQMRRFQMPEAKIAEAQAEWEKTERAIEEQTRKSQGQDRAHVERGVATARGRLQELEAELAALSPGERLAPAVVVCRRHRPSGLCFTAGESGARRLVVANPQFFDRSLPRTKFQLLVLFRKSAGGEVAPERALAGAWETLDWSRLAAIVR